MAQREMSLGRWHKVAERLASVANDAAAKAKAVFCSTSVDGWAGDEQRARLESQARDAAEALAIHAEALTAAGKVRSALGEANARTGVSAALAEQETLNKRIKLLRELLDGQKAGMVSPSELSDYKPLGDTAQKARYYRGEEPQGAISVRTMDAATESAAKAELDALRQKLFAVADKVNDLNRERLSIDLGEAGEKLAGLV